MQPSPIAIIGIAGRFPGARNPEALWQNLRDGIESIRDLSDVELRANGASAEDIANPDYVKRASILDDVPLFDASFFGFSPRDASILDPQHRHFLECAWEAFEDAGHPPRGFEGSVGVFAGSGMNSYLIHNLLANRRLLQTAGIFQLKQTGNDKDVLATRVSYQLDLRGPSINVQTACSTSLVAVHLACQSLLNFECDMALAGGVTIEIPHGQGYVYREGEILSRDGHCRAFDASSSGTVFGSGLGIVVLRRLEDALRDGDHIRALILGSAINNDGARKVGYLAPSVEGQADVIAEALGFAGVPASSISYVETHGTGTVVGDPIEVRALTNAFRASTGDRSFCGIGSLKTNIGHLDAAAGVAGLIKTVLALENGAIPPSLHFERINPHIEIETSPFYVNAKLRVWEKESTPRRAGVTSLGIGGTNAHVVLEEAPERRLIRRPKPCEILVVSGKTAAAADKALANLAAHFDGHSEANLQDVAFTLQVGRESFPHRRAVVVETGKEAVDQIRSSIANAVISGQAGSISPRIAFMFSGQGSQHVNMGLDLYQHEPAFQNVLDECARKLSMSEGIDLLRYLYPEAGNKEESDKKLSETWLTQPALFAVEYALARWWMSLGIEPAAMLGHSIGEYVAACLAGVFTLDDALRTVALRGRLIFGLPAGSMLAVMLPASELTLDGNLSIAAINHPNQSVVSGPADEVQELEHVLTERKIGTRRLHTSHAFHSTMMEPILGAFETHLRGIQLNAPKMPYLSNVTGTWIQPSEATDPTFWARHIRQPVQFSANLQALAAAGCNVFVEVGPGNVLTALAAQQSGSDAEILQSLPHPRENASALRRAYSTAAHLWVAGARIKWTGFHSPDSVCRTSLPTYPFERQRFWIEPDHPAQVQVGELPRSSAAQKEESVRLYQRTWNKVQRPVVVDSDPSCWIVFRDSMGLGDSLIRRLLAQKDDVICVDVDSKFRQLRRSRYGLRPGVREDYDALLAQIIKDGFAPRHFVHLWSVVSGEASAPLEDTTERSFYSPLFLAQALGAQDIVGVDIALVTNSLQRVTTEKVVCPQRAVVFGPGRVIPKELPGIRCLSLDFDLKSDDADACAANILAEMRGDQSDGTLAFRGSDRFVESFAPLALDGAAIHQPLMENGVYIITGGLGGLGLSLAQHLARLYKARLVLVGRSPIPDPSQWDALLGSQLTSEGLREQIRKLVEIRSHAGALMIEQGDVTDPASMHKVVAAVRKEFGGVDGVFHAAGVLDDGPLMFKTTTSASRVLDVKVRGTLVLKEALEGETLRCFVLFSSISAVSPPPGQVDYAAANAFLDSYAQSAGEPFISINWGAWRDVGMAARSILQHPLLHQKLLESANEVSFRSNFALSRHWFLSEHKLKSGTALIPGTGYLEMVAAAYLRNSALGAVEFADVYFTAPLTLRLGEAKSIRVNLIRDTASEAAGAGFRFSIRDDANGAIEYCSGTVAPCLSSPESWVDRAGIRSRTSSAEIVFDDKNRTRQERFLDFGSRWHCLRRISVGQNEGLAELELNPALASDLKSFHMHPALLDMATGCALYLTAGYENSSELYLPFSYKKIRIYDKLPARFFSHIRARSDNRLHADIENFDLTLFDEQDHVLVEIEGFAMRRLAEPSTSLADLSDQSVASSPVASDTGRLTGPTGIAPGEGIQTLAQILSHNSPLNVIAVSEPLENREVTRSAPSRRTMGAPDNPEEVGSTLLTWWSELLGVEHVDLDDDFFALGGHSLVGIRLFAKIKKVYRVDLELGVLFEARTVRQLAQVIRKAQTPVPSETKSWSCLVPIQTQGSRVPLFCIHAIGGDVLFYEKLAKSLGPSQPFYAFRSPLVSQSPARDTSLEELASIYVKEMRAFYPEGPYLLGGLSYGGLVAFEMAQQLVAEGIDPGLLVLFDTSVPGSLQHVEASDQFLTFWHNLREQGPTYITRKAAVKTSYWRRLMQEWTQSATLAWYRRARWEMPADLRYLQVQETHKRALEHYTFKPYRGKITLMRAVDLAFVGIESLSQRIDPGLGWGKFAGGGLEIHDIPAGHSSMLLEPAVRTLAEMLKVILATSDTTAPRSRQAE